MLTHIPFSIQAIKRRDLTPNSEERMLGDSSSNVKELCVPWCAYTMVPSTRLGEESLTTHFILGWLANACDCTHLYVLRFISCYAAAHNNRRPDPHALLQSITLDRLQHLRAYPILPSGLPSRLHMKFADIPLHAFQTHFRALLKLCLFLRGAWRSRGNASLAY